MGDKITAKVISLDNGKISLSAKALMDKPEGYVEREPMQRRESRPNPRYSGGGSGYQRR
ncbi:hypothetical protein LDC_0443 [sediment metagenome]|uniref:30S ribosomal protein S1 n=1 Tax=sediment metagenome TaxID=749907 RepID=D9PFZ8_9ZZZZ